MIKDTLVGIKTKKKTMKKFTPIEILILLSVVTCIFYSEYLFVYQKDYMKALFIGLWPPTMLGLLNFINSKTK